MKITIIGTGGVGGYFGGVLARAGNEVTFIARGKQLKAIQKKGLIVKSVKGDFSIVPAETSDNLSSVKGAELVLVCTKAWQVKEVAPNMARYLDRNCMVMPLQNGILAAEELAESIPSSLIIGGLCRIISLVESPGVIYHGGIEPTIVFGELNNEKTERA